MTPARPSAHCSCDARYREAMTNEACLCGNSIPDRPPRCGKCGLAMCEACNTLAQQPGRSHARGLGPECNPDILAARRDETAITSSTNPGRELRTPIEP